MKESCIYQGAMNFQFHKNELHMYHAVEYTPICARNIKPHKRYLFCCGRSKEGTFPSLIHPSDDLFLGMRKLESRQHIDQECYRYDEIKARY